MINNRMGTLIQSFDNPFSNNQLERLIENVYTMRGDMVRSAMHKRKDVNLECDYPETAEIQVKDYKNMYDRNPLGNRACGVVADECWQINPEMIEDDDVEVSTPFETDFKETGRSLLGEESWHEDELTGNPIWEYLHRADRLSGIGHFGIIVIGIDDGEALDKPAPGFKDPDTSSNRPGPVYVLNEAKKAGKRKLIYLSVFDESCIQNVDFEQNKHSPRFRKPKHYTIDFGQSTESQTSVMGRSSGTMKVHWSRIVHLCDNMDSSEVISVPRQRPVWNHLLDSMKLYGGDAEAFWRNCCMRIFLETHPQLGGDVTVDHEGLRSAMWDMDNGLQKYMTLVGMGAKTVAPSVVDPTAHLAVLIEAICIQLKVPKRIFMGSERGELSSDQDDSTWNDRVRGRQRGYLTSRVIAPFTNRLIQLNVLSKPKSYKTVWPDPEELKPGEKADVAVKRTTALATYADSPGASILVQPLDFLVRFLDLDDDEAKQIIENTEEAQLAEQEAMLEQQTAAAAAGGDVMGPDGQMVGPDGQPLPPELGSDGEPLPPKPGAAPPAMGPDGKPLPPKPGQSPVPGAVPAALATPLNGAQITAAKDILLSVSAGGTPPDVGEELLVAVGLPRPLAAKMAASAGGHKVSPEDASTLQEEEDAVEGKGKKPPGLEDDKKKKKGKFPPGKKRGIPVPSLNQADQTITYYQDVSGNPAEKAVAFAAEVVEYRGEAELSRTYGILQGD